MSIDAGTWVAALLTLALFSFLYRENPVFRFAEHLLVGVSAGYYLVQYFSASLVTRLYVPLFHNHEYLYVLGGLLGFLMFTRLVPTLGWVSRYPLAFYVCAGAGYAIPSTLQARVLNQMGATMTNFTASATFWAGLSSFLLFAGVVSCLVYFYFSAEHKGAVGAVSRIGIVFLMIGFGASFGYTVMGRITLLIGRIQFLLVDWLGVLR
jgi:hypothetical protein